MDGIAWAGSAMVAARSRLDIATENLANVSTDGFARIEARASLTPSGVTIARTRGARHGALRATGRDFDLAIVGAGAFSVRGRDGAVAATRNGAFTRERDGCLRDGAGRALLGASGHAIRVSEDVRIESDGRVTIAGRLVDRIGLPTGSSLQRGFLEGASVDAIREMIDVLAAQRSFESAEKIVSAIDRTREKSAGDVARVK